MHKSEVKHEYLAPGRAITLHFDHGSFWLIVTGLPACEGRAVARYPVMVTVVSGASASLLKLYGQYKTLVMSYQWSDWVNKHDISDAVEIDFRGDNKNLGRPVVPPRLDVNAI